MTDNNDLIAMLDRLLAKYRYSPQELFKFNQMVLQDLGSLKTAIQADQQKQYEKGYDTATDDLKSKYQHADRLALDLIKTAKLQEQQRIKPIIIRHFLEADKIAASPSLQVILKIIEEKQT